MRILVCGSRHWTDKELIRATLLKLLDGVPDGAILAHGDNGYDARGRALWGPPDYLAVRGADKLAAEVAYNLGLRVYRYTPDWKTYGPGAGPVRNKQMLREFKPTLVLAFTDDLAASKGTKHMVSIARAAGVPVVVVGHGSEP